MLEKNHFKCYGFVLMLWSSMLSAYDIDTPTFSASYLPCLMQPELQQSRSEELQELVDADQAIREKWDGKWENMPDSEGIQMQEEDRARRRRVGEIFGEGCFQNAKDYAAAALIFQHGDAPDHFFQAFIWSLRGVELGDDSQRHFAALTIDRYLISIGKKQLFGSQAMRIGNENNCYCMPEIEATFPDARRLEFGGVSLQERYERVASLNTGKYCPELFCAMSLQPAPQGSVPGFW